jgi:RNA dependent RNA polymerase
LWFFASTATLSREQFLLGLGDFSGVDKTKLGDRISLCFTQTKPLLHLSMDQILAESEVIHDGYCFSDGCGIMGWRIAKRIAEIDKNTSGYGSIQIRLGGVKGMLTVRKDFPPDKIGIRPSMCKFSSEHRMLEVKRVAEKKTSGDKSLFADALLILGDLGVGADVFMDLQRRAWAKLALTYDRGAQALLEEPVDYREVSRYLQKVIGKGIKYNGEKFSLEELQGMARRMEEGKKGRVSVNLHCSITLMLGVCDEHNLLGEGEVLVGNGAITGRVLICRPPTNAPGDIQIAMAVSGRDDLTALSGSLVFSVKGNRPLADMLGGGDYDGDEYYIIDEPQFVKCCVPVDPCDFGSKKETYAKDVLKYFSVVSDASSPSLDDQLDVLHNLFQLGNVIVASADAWKRLADRYTTKDERALRLSRICQRSLDARKLACEFSQSDFEDIDNVLSDNHDDRIDRPRWNGGHESNPSNSVLGVLFLKWQDKIAKIKSTAVRLRGLLSRSPPGALGGEDESVFSEITEGTRDTRKFDSDAAKKSLSSRSGTEILIDVTFDRDRMGFPCAESIDYKIINKGGRMALINMVLIEYAESLKRGMQLARTKAYASGKPQAYDVFLIKVGASQEHLAICQPVPRSDRELQWRVSHGIIPLDAVDYKCRVGTMSSYCRILDNLLCNPVPELMQKAMNREGLFDAIDPAGMTMNCFTSSLNRSQKKAVATVATPTFCSGFFVIQGPPGTGIDVFCARGNLF